jgi:serine/threonine protein kinase
MQEIEMGPILSTTLKSVIYRATWRGLPVVAKTTSVLSKSKSGKSLVEMAEEDTNTPTESENKDLALQEAIHEIRLLSTLRHPDLVMFLGACFDHKTPFFITEFMEGGDLERYYMAQARRTGHPYTPSVPTLVKWASSVARALSFLHGCSRAIIHRDLKPLNLLLNRSEDLKVTDFGISKLMAPKRLSTESVGPLQAKPEMSGGIGTWRYMAPEVVRYEQYTDKVDVYSFALILWFMSTGCQPFVKQFGPDAELVLKEYLRGGEPRPELAQSRGSEGIKQLMEDCWHKVPSSRPSAYECTQRLAAICAQESAKPLTRFNDKFSTLFSRQTTV